MDERGHVTWLELGNGVEVFASYDEYTDHLDRIEAYKAGTKLQDVDYQFNMLGNLTERLDTSTAGQSLEEDFTYDNLNRLTRAQLKQNGVATQSPLELQYSVSGNIEYKSDVGWYEYNGAGPHAVSKAGSVSYSYDANGNQTSGDGRTITYTVFDKPDTISRGTNEARFNYGAGSARYRRVDLENAVIVKTTLYLGNVERITDASGTYFKRNLGVAIQDFRPQDANPRTLFYLLKDHLGSIHTVLDRNGGIETRMHFDAFGRRTNTTWDVPLAGSQWYLNSITTRGFTGHEQVDSIGLIHMNGRVYDPKLGRFLRADPFVQAPKDTQSLNRYSYVFNNPLSYTDPTGYFSFSRFWKKIRPFVAIAVAFWNPGAYLFANSILAGAATGFIAGGIATGSLKGALIGAFTGAAFGALHNWKVDGFHLGKVAAHGAVGGVASELNGGQFGHGFFAAGFTQLASQAGVFTDSPTSVEDKIDNAIKAAVVGGTTSEIAGGKFANGAVTGAFSRALNDDLFDLQEKLARISAERKILNQIDKLNEEDFRTLFPEYGGLVDLDLNLAKEALFTGWRSELFSGKLLAIVKEHAPEIVKDGNMRGVSRGLGLGGKSLQVVAKSLKLNPIQTNVLSSTYRVQSALARFEGDATTLGSLAAHLRANPDDLNWYNSQ